MAVTVYYVRHGQSEANLENPEHDIIFEEDNPSLTNVGRLQSIDIGRRIKLLDLNFDGIYCSPLGRATETCQLALSKAGIDYSRVIIDERLKEREVYSFDTALGHRAIKLESVESLESRARSFLRDARMNHNGKAILVFAHGIIAHAFCGVVKREKHPLKLSVPSLGNGEFIHFRY